MTSSSRSPVLERIRSEKSLRRNSSFEEEKFLSASCNPAEVMNSGWLPAGIILFRLLRRYICYSLANGK
jgi:hypothetical protein